MLHTTLKINESAIASFMAVRVTNTHAPFIDDDLISTYKVEFYDPERGSVKGDVQHRYGDGGWKLLQKAIEELL